MRLHNRQVKAAFWTDTALIKLLDIVGRMFYQGLWQLADDSGCLDYDLLAFKIHLFPIDDIAVEAFEDWTNKLIEAKKLIQYEAEGKKCLYLKNFHKHQTLSNCPIPDVPLPDWIIFETYKSNSRQGKYRVKEDILTDYLYSSYNKTIVSAVGLQIPSNQNLNQNLNQNQNLIDKSDSPNPTQPAETLKVDKVEKKEDPENNTPPFGLPFV